MSKNDRENLYGSKVAFKLEITVSIVQSEAVVGSAGTVLTEKVFGNTG